MHEAKRSATIFDCEALATLQKTWQYHVTVVPVTCFVPEQKQNKSYLLSYTFLPPVALQKRLYDLFYLTMEAICTFCGMPGHSRSNNKNCEMNRKTLEVIPTDAAREAHIAPEQVRRRLAVFLRQRFANGQQQVLPQNQQENQLQEDVPAEDDLDPYDPIAEDAVDVDAPVQDEDAEDAVPDAEEVLDVEGLDPECMLSLQTMLEEKNRFCGLYKTIREREAAQGGVVEHYKILLKAAREKKAPRRRQYDIPSANEIAVIIPGNETAAEKRDIVIEGKGGRLRRINETHPNYDPLQYVLLHPAGEDGWTHNTHLLLAKNEVGPAYPGDDDLAEAADEAVPVEGMAQVDEEQAEGIYLEGDNDNDNDNDELLAGDEDDGEDDFWVDFDLDGADLDRMDEGPKDKCVSMRAYYAYRLQIRAISETDWRSFFWMFGRLCHQYVVDQYAKIEAMRLRYFRDHQKECRVADYKGVVDAIAKDQAAGRTG
ncbi:hypothetical protein KVV02_003126, partial [Mortierella alpina]